LLTKRLIDEKNNLKVQLESQNLSLTREIKQLQFIQEDSQEEIEKLRNENKQLYVKNFHLEELEINIKQIESKKKELEDYVKILEIEKEETYNRCCSLQEIVENENYKYSITKKQLREKDHEAKLLKKKIEELTNTINDLRFKLKDQQVHKNYQNNESKYTASCSVSNKTLDYESNSSSVSSLYPELCKDLGEERNYSFNITCPLVVEKMVGPKDTKDPKSPRNDIYKDYFILTFQALKLNSENMEPFLNVGQRKMYEEILRNNIPFHKVRIFINNFSFLITFCQK